LARCILKLYNKCKESQTPEYRIEKMYRWVRMTISEVAAAMALKVRGWHKAE
jgi:hypothetical protein